MSFFGSHFMFDRVDVKPAFLASLVEVSHDYADLRRDQGYPLGSHDQKTIYHLDCQVQDAPPGTETISVARDDIDRLWELRRRMRLLDWPWPTRVLVFYVIASYVFIAPFVLHNPCIAVLAPFGGWMVPYFPIAALAGNPLSGARMMSMFVLGLWVSWRLFEAYRLSMLIRWRTGLLAFAWFVAVLLVVTQFEARRFGETML